MNDQKKFALIPEKKPPSKPKPSKIEDSLLPQKEDKKPLGSLFGGDSKVSQGLFGKKTGEGEEKQQETSLFNAAVPSTNSGGLFGDKPKPDSKPSLFDAKTPDPVKGGLFGNIGGDKKEPEKKAEEKKPSTGGLFSLKPGTDAPKPSLFGNTSNESAKEPQKPVEKRIEMNLGSGQPAPSLSSNPFLGSNSNTTTNPFLTSKKNEISQVEKSSLVIPKGDSGIVFPQADANKSMFNKPQAP